MSTLPLAALLGLLTGPTGPGVRRKALHKVGASKRAKARRKAQKLARRINRRNGQ